MGNEMTYRQAGVDIDAADNTLNQVKNLVAKTHGPEVLKGIGAFGGLFQPRLDRFKDPVIVSSADGIGTKVMVANAVGKFKNLGHDLVNHCTNDIGVMGAKPLFFLDYLAFGVLRPEVATEIIEGMTEACMKNNCALLGGETAEMPDLYTAYDFDVAGFIVGLVDKSKILDGSRITPGDVLIGIASNGLHTNGYSLVRRIFFSENYKRATEVIDKTNTTLVEALLRPHLSYLPLLNSLEDITLHGVAHITGGGIAGNLSRILPDSSAARINWGAWDIPGIFQYIQDQGTVPLHEMRRVFNMGLGLIIACLEQDSQTVLDIAEDLGFTGAVVGSIVEGKREVTFD